MKRVILIVLVSLIAAAVSFADLPDVFGEALAEIELDQYFVPDPHEHEMTAGGSLEFDAAADIPGDYFKRDDEVDVSGYVYGDGPDVRFYYNADSPDTLSFAFVADEFDDTFLVVNDPDGDWWVVDDSDDSLDPYFSIENPPSGRYDIWVGTWEDIFVSGTFMISEY